MFAVPACYEIGLVAENLSAVVEGKVVDHQLAEEGIEAVVAAGQGHYFVEGFDSIHLR